MSWWHKHRYKVTGAMQLQRETQTILLTQKIICPVTEVLMVCECGFIKTACLDGHWTLEQLQPQPGGVTADSEFFRKLGVKL